VVTDVGVRARKAASKQPAFNTSMAIKSGVRTTMECPEPATIVVPHAFRTNDPPMTMRAMMLRASRGRNPGVTSGERFHAWAMAPCAVCVTPCAP